MLCPRFISLFHASLQCLHQSRDVGAGVGDEFGGIYTCVNNGAKGWPENNLGRTLTRSRSCSQRTPFYLIKRLPFTPPVGPRFASQLTHVTSSQLFVCIYTSPCKLTGFPHRL